MRNGGESALCLDYHLFKQAKAIKKNLYDQNRCIMGVDLQVIQRKIYEIRGQRVMLDFDLAELYQVETRRLKEQVKRNIERFSGGLYVCAFVAIRRLLLYPPEVKIGKLGFELEALREYVKEAFADYNDIHGDTRLQRELVNQALAELQVKQKAT